MKSLVTNDGTNDRRHILRVLARWAILTKLLAAGLFGAAGTRRIAMLRAYLVVFSALLLVTMLAALG